MQKFIRQLYLLALGATCIISVTSYAQSFWGNNTNSSNSIQNSPNASLAKPLLSPTDFKSAVTTQGQQTRNNLTQQFNQELSTQPSPLSQTNMNNNANNSNQGPDTTNPASTNGAPSTVNNQTPPVNNLIPGPNNNTMQQPMSSVRPAPPPPPAQPGQTYTGFGTGNTTPGATSAPAGNNSTNWNVKY